ncbi:hypothetical protein PTSG_05214 [Salpingoeca rosetta]|uniref:Misato Segment II tubulin-like domain-containing protein n=1 Tax=Salpingoeca rosetta (strain ATCC 50818 / BSB-021) TaxID=946362 RepID=F2UAU4_SALR5|nr:uncharacterized protein PTSG_05214 [Salpingoeca rosetta]EGD73510.1 hypothetical protein PTSG_05214 [Salpingoeca rosetta]|eukprot:XP_004993792.1 hypothetical protein PTSG_05214 [Salpingoeca rosetta]
MPAGGGGEVITLQFGNYANHVGAHFWNLQDAMIDYTGQEPESEDPISHDVLFRCGETPSGAPTYTPRLLLYDLRDSTSALSQEGVLYGDASQQAQVASWDPERVERLMQPLDEPSPYHQHLEQLQTQQAGDRGHSKSEFVVETEHVRSWSDYLRPLLHPRTVNLVPTHCHEDPAVAFDAFWLARPLLQPTAQFMETFEDRVRAYMEECDTPYGFQIVADADTAFAGIAAGAIQHLRDEYGRKGIMCYAAHSPGHSLGYDAATAHPELDEEHQAAKTAAHAQHRLRSAAYLMYECMQYGATYIPLSTHDAWRDGSPRAFLRLDVDYSSRYHTSAIMAAAIDTATLPYRLHSSDVSFAHLMSALQGPASMAGMTTVLPFEMDDYYLSDMFSRLEAGQDLRVVPLTPSFAPDLTPAITACSLRGINATKVKPPIAVLRQRGTMSAYDRCDSPNEMLQRFLGSGRRARQFMARVVSHGLPVGSPFPDWFHHGGRAGRSVTVSTMASLETGPAVHASAAALASTFLAMRHRPYLGPSWEREEFDEMRQVLSDRLLDEEQ